jgi:VanZ family protein
MIIGEESIVTRLVEATKSRWALVLAWMGLIFFLSSRSTLPKPSGISSSLEAITGHFTVYAVLAALVAFALADTGLPTSRRLAVAFLFAVVYGVSDEFHQSFVPGRDPDLFDLMIDAIGAATGLVVFMIVERWRLMQRLNPASLRTD